MIDPGESRIMDMTNVSIPHHMMVKKAMRHTLIAFCTFTAKLRKYLIATKIFEK